MEILGRSTSVRFDRFYKRQKDKLGKSFHFRDISTKPDASDRGHRALSYSTQSEVIVMLDPNLEIDIFETLAAHEIMHTVLELEGFPAAQPTARHIKDQSIIDLAAALASTLLDPVINPRLANMGFAISRVREIGIAEIKQQLADIQGRDAQLPIHVRCRVALDYLLCYLDLPSDRFQQMDSLYAFVAPAFRETGQTLVQIVKKHGYKIPSKCLRSMVTMRDASGLQGISMVYDPRGDRFL